MNSAFPRRKSHGFDALILGGGAAGLFCAAQLRLLQPDWRIAVVDHAECLGEKIRISGGGRCNFTNTGASWENYVSQQPRFARYALMQFTPQDFLQFLAKYQVGYHEKHKGQLFCNERSQAIIDALLHACQGVHWRLGHAIQSLQQDSTGGFCVQTSGATLYGRRVVVATGGMAAPAVGATDIGLQLARQWGLPTVDTRPALVPLVFSAADWQPYVGLAGVAVPAQVSLGKGTPCFDDDLLFTHKGLSGPAILQISSYWTASQSLHINLCPAVDLASFLVQEKKGSRQSIASALATHVPKRLVMHWLTQAGVSDSQKWADTPDKTLRQLASQFNDWTISAQASAGYKKAEAMRGGVSTKALHPHSMASRQHPQLYFIGEVVDVTGWLGGYNFQWAWSSATVCAQAMASTA